MSDEIRVKIKLWRIFLASFITFFSSYTALSYFDQFRLVSTTSVTSKFLTRHGYLFFTSISIGGVGFWSMHYLGLTSIEFTGSDNENIKIEYNNAIMVSSLILILLLTCIGLRIGSFDKIFFKTKREILEMLVENNSHLSLARIKDINMKDILYMLCTKNLQTLLTGSFIMTSGLIAMSYLTLQALQFKGAIQFNIGVVIASILLAYITSVLTFWILFRFLALFPQRETYRLMCSIVLTLALVGVHFTCFAACTFVRRTDVDRRNPRSSSSSVDDTFTACFVFSVGTCFILFMVLVADVRSSVHKTVIDLKKADDVIGRIKVDPASTNGILINQYLLRKKAVLSPSSEAGSEGGTISKRFQKPEFSGKQGSNGAVARTGTYQLIKHISTFSSTSNVGRQPSPKSWSFDMRRSSRVLVDPQNDNMSACSDALSAGVIEVDEENNMGSGITRDPPTAVGEEQNVDKGFSDGKSVNININNDKKISSTDHKTQEI